MSRRGMLMKLAPAAIVVVVLGLALLPPLFEKRLATIALAGIGASGESALSPRPGSTIHFAVYARSISYKGGDYILLDARLKKDGVEVATMSCRSFELEGWGHESHVAKRGSDCAMKVPPGGASSIRVTTRLESAADVTVEGLEVRVVE